MKNPRTISLNGDITGSTNFDGSGNVTITTNLANVAVLTGTITGDGTESPSKSLSYPSGFTRDNCVVLTVNLQRTNNDNKGYGTVFDSSSYVAGAIPAKVVLDSDDILLEIRSILISSGAYPNSSVISSSVSFNYTIMLMKI